MEDFLKILIYLLIILVPILLRGNKKKQVTKVNEQEDDFVFDLFDKTESLSKREPEPVVQPYDFSEIIDNEEEEENEDIVRETEEIKKTGRNIIAKENILEETKEEDSKSEEIDWQQAVIHSEILKTKF